MLDWHLCQICYPLVSDGDNYFSLCVLSTSNFRYSVYRNLDVYTFSHSHEIYLLQPKVNRLISLILYVCFQTLNYI